MKVAIVGSSGYIAGFLLERFNNEKYIETVLRIDCNNDTGIYLDLAKAEEFDYTILSEIDYVIFAAAISEPDKCAKDFELCWKINVEGTSYFIKMAIKHNCKVLFFSSDAVFGNIPGCIYTEESETKAETPYGRMKKAIEDRFKMIPGFKTIRLSYVVSAKDRFVTYCLDCVRNNKEADIFHPFYRNCITVSDVADVIVWFLNYWDEYKTYVLNVAGRELVSRIRIADEINRFLGYKLKYKISAPGQEFFTNRPETTQMKSLYLHRYHILEDNTFTEKIQKELIGVIV